MKINAERYQLQEQIKEEIRKSGYRCGFVAPTGSGKAKILVDSMLEVKPENVIFLTNSIRNRDITFIDEMIKWGAEEYLDRIELMCYQSAYKLKGKHYQLVLADEVDICADAYFKFFQNNTFDKIIYTSATMMPKKRKMLETVAPIVYETGLKEVQGQGIVNDSKYFLVKYLLSPKENAQYLKYNAIFAAELSKPRKDTKKLEFIQIQRNLFLSKLQSSVTKTRELLDKLYKETHRKILIFSGVAAQADKVCKYSYHSHNKADDLFKDFGDGKIRVIAVVGKVDRGENIDGVNTIVFEAPKKSQTKWQQKSGRGRRLDVEEYLDIFYMVPYYRDRFGHIKPTIVESWVISSSGTLNIKPEIYNI